MLVLSRKRQESVVVGGSTVFSPLLKVTVIEIKGGTVRLGFEAPAEVPVHRWEIWEKIVAAGKPGSPATEDRLPSIVVDSSRPVEMGITDSVGNSSTESTL